MQDNMADRYFNFDDQFRTGVVGENDFVRVYGEMGATKSVDRKADVVLGDGKTVELKTDTYDMAKTPNFFMEQLTVSDNGSNLGGPWRSKEHDIDYFVYYFLSNKVFFWFTPVTLCEFLDKYIAEHGLRPIKIPNKDRRGGYYEALGFKIPRDSVKPVLIREHKA